MSTVQVKMSFTNRFLQVLLRIFRCFGVCLVDSPASPTTSTFLMSILNMGNIVTEGILLYLCNHFARKMFDFSHTIGLIVDVVQIVLPIVTHLVCLFECLHQKSRMIRIWHDLMYLVDVGGERMRPILKASLITYLCIGTASFGLCTAIEVWILFHASKIWFRSRAVAQWSFMSCRAAFCFYLLHVVIVGSVVKMIVQELKYSASASRSQLKSARVEMQQQNILRNVRFCRSCYERLYRISLEMSYGFGWSLVCQLMYKFMDITIALYYNYRRVSLGMLTAESLLAWVPLLVMLVVPVCFCEYALLPLRKIPYHLHRVQRHSSNQDLHREIVRFSCQLLHQKIKFNARRFLDVDFQLLKGVGGTIYVEM